MEKMLRNIFGEISGSIKRATQGSQRVSLREKTFQTNQRTGGRGQVTLFIILAMILLIAFATMTYFVFKVRRESPVEQQLWQLPVQEIRTYVTDCLALATKQAVVLLGQQGGVLYKDQGGLTEPPRIFDKGLLYLPKGNNRIWNLITPPEGSVQGLYSSTPPEYPWAKFPIYTAQDGTTTKSYLGYFGLSKLPPLYSEYLDSIQKSLQAYAETKVQECTQWENFQKKGLVIETGKPNITTVIANTPEELGREEGIAFLMKWQIELKSKTTDAKTTLNDFTVRQPIKFGRLYYFVRTLIDQDVNNASYSPKTEPPYTVQVEKDAYEFDDLITIQDASSKLEGKPYEFRFGRKNRVPAIQWIDQTTLDTYHLWHKNCKGSTQPTMFIESDKLRAITVEEVAPGNYELVIQLNAIDPDEDAVVYDSDRGTKIEVDSVPTPPSFRLKVYAKDNAGLNDYQELLIKTGCPQPG